MKKPNTPHPHPPSPPTPTPIPTIKYTKRINIKMGVLHR